MANLRRLDRAVLVALRTRFHGRRTERAVAAVSLTGEMGGFWIALGLAGVALDPERRGRWALMTAIAPATIPVNYLVKIVVRRRRPRLRGLPPLGHVPASHSFPVGARIDLVRRRLVRAARAAGDAGAGDADVVDASVPRPALPERRARRARCSARRSA